MNWRKSKTPNLRIEEISLQTCFMESLCLQAKSLAWQGIFSFFVLDVEQVLPVFFRSNLLLKADPSWHDRPFFVNTLYYYLSTELFNLYLVLKCDFQKKFSF